MNKYLQLGMMGVALAFQDNYNDSVRTSSKIIDFTPKIPPTPKGAKIYYFDLLGDCREFDNGQYEFKCVAINEKSARNKFNKWLKTKTT